MIISRLRGGLGNQIFQYALGRTLADNFNDELFLDISYFNKASDDTPRNYSLSFFNIRAEIASLAMTQIKNRPWTRFLNFGNTIWLAEKKLNQYDDRLLNLSAANYYLDGYWQTEKYFLKNRQKIISDLSLAKSLSQEASDLAKKISSVNAVAVHIRRGDYLTKQAHSNIFHVQSPEYYYKAMTILKNKLASPVFFIFSDDSAWCQSNLSFDAHLVFVDSNAPHDFEQLVLMSLCSNHIIANSSFSWWGAWLAVSPDKTVIAPKNWFKVAAMASEDIIPDNWLKI